MNVTSNRSDNQFEYVQFMRGGSLTGDGDGFYGGQEYEDGDVLDDLP